MTRSLSVLPLAIVLAAAVPTSSRADDTADQCRKMAIEEEVAPEDMEDYIAECLAVVQSESSDDAASAMDRLDADAPDAGSAPETGGAPAQKP